MRYLSILTVVVLASAHRASAQAGSSTTPPAAEATKPSLIDRIRAASNLPTRTAEAREAGVPDSTLRRVLDIFKQRETDPVEAETIITAARDGARENGPTDNFGSFVQSQLEAGKHGRELAAAIRAEHRARGHGRGRGNGNGPQGDRGVGRQKAHNDSATSRPMTTPAQGNARRPN